MGGEEVEEVGVQGRPGGGCGAGGGEGEEGCGGGVVGHGGAVVGEWRRGGGGERWREGRRELGALALSRSLGDSLCTDEQFGHNVKTDDFATPNFSILREDAFHQHYVQ